MNKEGIEFKYKVFLAISLLEVLIYLFFTLSNAYMNRGFVVSASLMVMVSFGSGLLGIAIFILFAFVHDKDSRFYLSIKEKVINIFRNQSFVEILLLLAFLSVWVYLLLRVVPQNTRDFLGDILFIRLAQYYPVFFISGLISAQGVFLSNTINRFSSSDDRWFHLENKWIIATILFCVSFFIYLFTSVSLHQLSTPKIAYFPQLAEAFLQGRTYLIDPPSVKDLSPFNGNYYVSFPPLGALLMLPVVSMVGSGGVNTALWNVFFASLGVAFIFLALVQLRRLGWSKIDNKGNVLLAFFLGFGSVQYFIAIRGHVYFISQILTATILCFSLWIALIKVEVGKGWKLLFHAILTGLVFSTALLARPNVIFAAVGLVAIQYQIQNKDTIFDARNFILWTGFFLIPIALVVGGLAWYNQIRFGSPFDFGYGNMLVVAPALIRDLSLYGQFHPHFIIRNIQDNFLRLPEWNPGCGVITPNPNGMSIFIVSPLLMYLHRSFRRDLWVVGLWISILLIMLVHLMYFNSGALQFGYRFSLDFMPLIVLLLAVSLKERLTKLVWLLWVMGIAINFIGVLWITRVWCVNW